jgi:hypothetical protein
MAIGAILASSASAQTTTSASNAKTNTADTSSLCRTNKSGKTDSTVACPKVKKSTTAKRTTKTTSGGDVGLTTSAQRTSSSVRIPVSKEMAVTPEPAPVVEAPAPAPVPVVVDSAPPPVVETPAPAPEPLPEPMPVKHYGNGFYIGLGAGEGIPVQTLRDGYDPGLSVSVPIGWDSQTGPFGIRGNFGYTRLDSRKTFRNTGATTGVGFGSSGSAFVASSDPQIWSALADLKLRFPFSGHYDGARSGLYVVGGGGVNYFRNYNTTFALTNPEFNNGTSVTATSESMTRMALNAGGGLTWGLGMTEVFLESRYVTTFTEGRRASYVPVILGLTFR